MGRYGLAVAALLSACPRPDAQPALPAGVEQPCRQAELERRPSPQMRALLESPSPAVRVRAALAVGRIGDAQAAARLAQLLSDPEAGETAAWALGRIDGGAPALVSCLAQGCRSAAAAARALAGPASAKVPQTDALVNALHGAASGEAAFALGILARNKEAKFPPQTWAELAKLLPSAGAAYALSRIPKGEAPGLKDALATAMRDGDVWTRSLAARAWGKQGLPASGLAAAFEDADWRVRV